MLGEFAPFGRGHWTAANPYLIPRLILVYALLQLPIGPGFPHSFYPIFLVGSFSWVLCVGYSALYSPARNMKLGNSLLQLALWGVAALPTVTAAAWGFTDATVSVHTKGAGVGTGSKDVYVSADRFVCGL